MNLTAWMVAIAFTATNASIIATSQSTVLRAHATIPVTASMIAEGSVPAVCNVNFIVTNLDIVHLDLAPIRLTAKMVATAFTAASASTIATRVRNVLQAHVKTPLTASTIVRNSVSGRREREGWIS